MYITFRVFNSSYSQNKSDLNINMSNKCNREITMQEILKTKLKDNQILLINATTGNQRAVYHEWAKRNGLISMSILSNKFDTNFGCKCSDCKQVWYEEEMEHKSCCDLCGES